MNGHNQFGSEFELIWRESKMPKPRHPNETPLVFHINAQ